MQNTGYFCQILIIANIPGIFWHPT